MSGSLADILTGLTILDTTWRYSTLLDASRRYLTLLNAFWRYSTLLDATRRYSTLLDSIQRYSTLLDAAWRCSTLLDAAWRCLTLLDATRRYSRLYLTLLGRQTWPADLADRLGRQIKNQGSSHWTARFKRDRRRQCRGTDLFWHLMSIFLNFLGSLNSKWSILL
jgi:hypothetical protein